MDEFVQELVERLFVSLDFDRDTGRPVLDEAVQIEASGQAVHERSEADSLNNPTNCYRATLHINNLWGELDWMWVLRRNNLHFRFVESIDRSEFSRLRG